MDIFSLKKNKKTNVKSVKLNIVKYFREDGEAVDCPFFKESDIKIDEFDTKVKLSLLKMTSLVKKASWSIEDKRLKKI